MSLLCMVSPRLGAGQNGPRADMQGNLLFGNPHWRTALRCPKRLVAILSFPKGAHRREPRWHRLAWPPSMGQVCAPRGQPARLPGGPGGDKEAS